MLHKISFKRLFEIIAILFAIVAAISIPTIGVMVLGGVITGGILGGFSGKVGAVVGAKWKSIWYMRGWVKPANPNSQGQQTQRTKMTVMVGYGRDLLTSILQPFWDPFYNTMSGFNAFVKENIGKLGTGNVIDLDCVMAKGNLEGVAVITGTYSTGNGNTTLTWDKAVSGNGLVTDSIAVVVADVTGKKLYGFTPVATRDDENVIVVIPSGLVATAVIVFAFFYRSVDDQLEVSNSVSDTCAAP